MAAEWGGGMISAAVAPTASVAPQARRGAAAKLLVECFGARVAIEADDAQLLDEIQNRLPPQSHVASGDVSDEVIRVHHAGDGGFTSRDGIGNRHSPDRDALLEDLTASLRFAIACHARSFVFIHGGAVRWKGRAVLIPGKSLSGKSTLTRALLEAGAEYYSDEHIVLDRDGVVHPWPKPLSLRRQNHTRQYEVAAESLGAWVAGSPAPAGLILLSSYRRCARWRPGAVPATEAALALAANAFAARLSPHKVMQAVSAAALQARCLRSHRPDARRVAGSILAAMESPNVPSA